MSIFCCGRKIKITEILYPFDEENKINQVFFSGFCSNCGAKICELNFVDAGTSEIKKIRPRRKEVDDFIKKIKSEPYLRFDNSKIKQGSKSNAGFVYGVNVEKKNKIIQFSVDFNGEKKIVKEILK